MCQKTWTFKPEAEMELSKCCISGCQKVEDESMLAANLTFCTEHGEEFWAGYFEAISKLPPCTCENCKNCKNCEDEDEGL